MTPRPSGAKTKAEFDRRWRRLARTGDADGIGGMEYRRHLAAWKAGESTEWPIGSESRTTRRSGRSADRAARRRGVR